MARWLCPVCRAREATVMLHNGPGAVCAVCHGTFWNGTHALPALSQEASSAPTNRALLREVYGEQEEKPVRRARRFHRCQRCDRSIRPGADLCTVCAADGLCHCSDYASVQPHARVIVCQPLRAPRAYKAPKVLAGQLRIGG